MKKRPNYILIFFLAGLTILFAKTAEATLLPGEFGAGAEPDGFRGIVWGTDISNLQDMKKCKSSSEPGFWLHTPSIEEYFPDLLEIDDIDVYLRQSDELKIGEANIERIEYGFWQGKFIGAIIFVKGNNNKRNLREALEIRFGSLGFNDDYWRGQKTVIIPFRPSIFPDDQEKVVFFYSRELYRKKYEYENELMEKKRSNLEKSLKGKF